MTPQPDKGHVFPDHTCGTIDQDRVQSYADVSGDDNPIHTDAAVARSIGLDGTIIQGMLLMALADQALGVWLPAATCRRLAVRFARPAPTGASIVVGGRVVQRDAAGGTDTATLRIFVKGETGTVFAMAEAVVAFSPA